MWDRSLHYPMLDIFFTIRYLSIEDLGGKDWLRDCNYDIQRSVNEMGCRRFFIEV